MVKKKKEASPILIYIPLRIYPFDVLVSIGHSDEQLDGILKRKGVQEDRDFAEYGFNGKAKYVLWPKYSYALIRLRELPRTSVDYGGLAHEILHVVIGVLRQVGMNISLDGGSDEAYTYLMSFLTTEIFREINPYY